MEKIEPIPYYDYEEDKKEAYKIIERILCAAYYYEQHLAIKPTVFMSRDVMALIARGERTAIVYQKRGDPTTVCGYDLKLALGENVLYIGQSI